MLLNHYPFIEITDDNKKSRYRNSYRHISKLLPDSPGLYFVTNNKSVLYIGKTEKSLKTRFFAHAKWSEFVENNASKIHYSTEDKELAFLEKEFIYFYDPILNKKGTKEKDKKDDIKDITDWFIKKNKLERLTFYVDKWGRIKYCRTLPDCSLEDCSQLIAFHRILAQIQCYPLRQKKYSSIARIANLVKKRILSFAIYIERE